MGMSAETSPEFGKLRNFFWPIHRDELKLFLPLLIMYFLICLNYSILRTSRDALVITAKSAGAEVLPFIKTWAILPASLLIMLFFTQLSNRLSKEKVFYIMISLFLLFFSLFAFVLYPCHESLHPHAFADTCEKILPRGLHGLIAVFRNWTFTVFYVMSELWGPAIMTVLFWGFANEITSVNAGKRFYAILAVGGNLALVFSGAISTTIANLGIKLNELNLEITNDAWGNSLVLIASVLLGSGVLTMAIFRWLNVKVLKSYLSQRGSFQLKRKNAEYKMGIRKIFAFLAQSKYLLCIATIVLMYNVAINFTEVVWKDQLHKLSPSPNFFHAYYGQVMTCIGLIAVVGAFFCGAIIRRFGWTFGAMVPPLILLATSVPFFLFLFTDAPLASIVFLGAMQHCLAGASKYTFYDATKEIAFIPLDQESKLKGKAAIDGVGSRIGKSGSALACQFLLMIFGSLSLSLPYIAVLLFVVIIAWIYAARSLGREFEVLSAARPTSTVNTTETILSK